MVEGALIAPYGVGTTGVLLSERLDAENCLRFHPVYGLDLSSLCLSLSCRRLPRTREKGNLSRRRGETHKRPEGI